MVWEHTYETLRHKWPLTNDAFYIQQHHFVVEYGGMKIGELYHDHQKIDTKMYENDLRIEYNPDRSFIR